MKALTIHQPFAFLIALPEEDPRHKRVENRSWSTHYEGPLAIHASKHAPLPHGWDACGAFLSPSEEAGLVQGAVVATATLKACIHITALRNAANGTAVPRDSLASLTPFFWVLMHVHTTGPWCWVLSDVTPLPEPIPARGHQGLWDWEPSALCGSPVCPGN